MSNRPILAETRTPDGVRVAIFEDTWLLHILNPHDGHAELEPHLKAVLDTLESPDHREQERWPDRERFLQARSRTYQLADGRRRLCKGASTGCYGIRLSTRALPGRMDTMNVKIDDLTFDRGHYDAEGDVLYLGRGDTNYGSDAALTPEGHGVRYDGSGEVIGVTIINARRIIEHDGYLTITLPHSVRIEAGELAAAFA